LIKEDVMGLPPQRHKEMAEARRKQRAEDARLEQARLPDSPARKAQMAQRKAPGPELPAQAPKQPERSKNFYKDLAAERKKQRGQNQGRGR
jgi:hypothetical protein